MASYKFISGPFFAGNSVLAIPGVYNGEALESVIENYSGKMDTVVLGTSLCAGGTATFPASQSWPRILASMLKPLFNGPAIPGGHGLILPQLALLISLANPYWNFPTGLASDRFYTGVPTVAIPAPGGAPMPFGGALRLPVAASAGTNSLSLILNGEKNPNLQTSDLEISYAFDTLISGNGTNAATSIYVDLDGSGSNPAANGGSPKISASHSTGTDTASNAQLYNKRVSFTNLNPASKGVRSNLVIRLSTGSTFAIGGVTPGDLLINGVIHYFMDYLSGYGFRVHVGAFPSSNITQLCLDSGDPALDATIGQFCTGTGDGARYCKLIIEEHNVNDMNVTLETPLNSVVNVDTQRGNLFAYAQNTATKPSWIYFDDVIPLCSVQAQNRKVNKPQDYIESKLEFAKAHNQTYINLYEYLFGTRFQPIQNNEHWSNLTQLGLASPDNIHLNNAGHLAVAMLMYRLFTAIMGKG